MSKLHIGPLAEAVDDKLPSLRDQFAMAALQGILSGRYNFQTETFPLEEVTTAAYAYADVMLEARKR